MESIEESCEWDAMYLDSGPVRKARLLAVGSSVSIEEFVGTGAGEFLLI